MPPLNIQTRNRIFAVGMVGAIGLIGAFPLWITTSRQKLDKNMMRSDQALTGSQVQRGPYVNSGSKDIGPDPDWDMKEMRWKGRRN